MPQKLSDVRCEDIVAMYKYFKKIRQQYRNKIFGNIYLCLANAFKISVPTIKTVIAKSESKSKKDSDGSENLVRADRRKKSKFDEFDKATVRRVVHGFYLEKQLPTLSLIKNRLRKQHDLQISITKLRFLLYELGFKWKRVTENKKAVVEQSDIVASRVKYLRDIQHYRRQGYHTVYLDESWINKNIAPSHTWLPEQKCETALDLMENPRVQLPKLPPGKGARLIILHAGCTETGFLPNCKLVFRAVNVDGDYHREMNGTVFMDWFQNKLIPALPPKSVVILDNASYHNLRVESTKSPTSATKKADIQKWLSDNKIPYTAAMLKPELLQLVKKHKPSIRYLTDEIAEAHGHRVLRTPVRHCELNPIELVWAQMKRMVARQNTSFKIKEVEELTNSTLDVITADYWRKCARHVIDIENKMRRLDGIFDIEPVIITLDDSSDSADSSDSVDSADSDTGDSA